MEFIIIGCWSDKQQIFSQRWSFRMVKDNAGYTSKEMLDAYIYDFLLKSSLNGSASIFCREAGMAINGIDGDVKDERERYNALKEIKDVPQGFLYEWWQLFWDLFNARTHKKGSALAEEYSEICLQKRKEEYSRRAQAVQAARMQHLAEENADYENELLGSTYFPAGVPNTQNPSNGIVSPESVRTKKTNKNKADQVAGSYNNTSSPTPTPPGSSVSSRGKANKQPFTKKGNTSINSSINNLDSRSPNTAVSNVSTPYENPTYGPNSVGKISGIEGLYNYQKQLMVSETEINNPKRNMLPPSAGISPQTVTPSNSSLANNSGTIPPSKPKMPRRRSTTYLMGSTPKSVKNAASDVIYSQSGPATPISATNSNVSCGDNVTTNNKPVLPSSLSTVSESYSNKNVSLSNGSPETSKKVSKKVRKQKKPQQISSNNSNYNFVASASVPTPPTDSQQKSQFKIMNKNQPKKSTTRNNKGIMKSSSDASPRLTLDDTSSTPPTFISTVWNTNRKAQTTPHSNFTFVGENTGFNPATSSINNTDTTAGSSSGGSYQFSENEAEDLLSINSILPTHDSSTMTNNIQAADKSHEIHDANQQDFSLELLESTEPSFNFLSWQQ